MKTIRYYNLQLVILILLTLFFGIMLNLTFKGKEHKRVDLSKGAINTLDKNTTDTLLNLGMPVKITYYTSEKRRMPTPMRNVEEDIRALLREMSFYGRSNFTYQVIYPEDQPQVARSLGRFRIAPFQFKTILKDEYSVSNVWSGILIEYKGQTRSIPYITKEHLPHLENRIITHIHQVDTGYKPFIAVYASSGHKNLRDTIIKFEYGEVRDFDFNNSSGVPLDADMAFICQPENLSSQNVESIKNFLADGKDIFLTFSDFEIREEGNSYIVIPKKSGLEDFLGDIGVKFEHKIVLEQKNLQGKPYLMNVQGSQVVLEGFRLQRSGLLLSPFTSPISVDVPKLQKNGYSSDTMMFSSKNSWTVPFMDKEQIFNKSDFEKNQEENSKPENIAICLSSDKAWEGRLFLYSSGFIFSDSANWNGANSLYIKNILMTFVENINPVSIQASREKKHTILPLSASARFFWRFVVVFLLPLAIFAVLSFKVLKFHLLSNAVKQSDLRLVAIFVLGTIALFFIISMFNIIGDISIDITKERANSLNPLTIKWVKGLNENINIYYFTSPSSEMPINSKKMVKEVLAKLKNIKRASRSHLKLHFEIIHSDDNNEALKEKLNKYGIKPFRMRMIENDRYVEKMVYSGLVFEKDGKSEVVPNLTLQNSSRLEFVVVSAIKRLIEQKRPSIAFLADLPHLTAGEFWELQQLEVQIQPRSEDVYSRLLEILRNDGYEVNIYDSQNIKNQFKEDLIIYLQPWIVEDYMKNEINRYLCSGKQVLLAAQHYFMQTRKYSGRAYELTYWPQPQFSRINELLDPYGIELVLEVFLDQSKASIDTKEQIRWGAYKKLQKRSPDAQPFIIRAVPSNFDKESSITSHLSDVLFIWGNRWRRLKNKFQDTLSWKPLISSTKDCWSLDWQGGFLPEESLQKGKYLDTKQPLAVLVEGKFPYIAMPANKAVVAKNGEEKGKLLLVGSSRLFENEQIDTTKYDNEKFILNSAADLAYGTEFAQMQASGGITSKGFPYIPPTQKMMWRIIIMLLSPFIFCIYALFRSR